MGAWKRATFVSRRVGCAGVGCKLGYICGVLEVVSCGCVGGGGVWMHKTELYSGGE